MNGIEITYNNGKINIASQFDKYRKEAELSKQETEFVKILKDIIKVDFITARHSEHYLTVIINEEHFLRFHIGKKVLWFSVLCSCAVRDKYFNDDRFSEAKKNLLHWRINISNIEELYNYSDILIDFYKELL